jgi:cell division protein FtsB
MRASFIATHRWNVMAPRRRPSHAREIYFILFIVFVVATLSFSIWGPGGYREMRRVQRELQQHTARVADLERSNRQRMQAIQALKSNPRTFEKYAREKGYAGPGEIVQQLPEDGGK